MSTDGTDGTDETRPLPAPDDETPTRAIEPVAADEATTDEMAGTTVTAAHDEPAGTTRPLPTTGPVLEPAAAPAPSTAAAAASTAVPAPAPAPATPAGSELRVGTVVWGLVVAVVGIGIVSFAWGARIDGGLALIVLLAGAGVALLVGSLVVAARRPRRRDGRG